MFKVVQKTEVFVRILLILMVVLNVVIPTTALAKPNLKNEALENSLTPRELPIQNSVYYEPKPVTSDFAQTEEDKEPIIPEKDEIEFSISTNEGEVGNDRIIVINVLIRNHSENSLESLIYYDRLENLFSYQNSSATPVRYNSTSNIVTYAIGTLNAGEETEFTYTLRLKNQKNNKIAIHNAEIEYELNGEVLAKTASLAFVDNSSLIDSEAVVLIPDQTQDGWETTGRYSLYLGEEVLEEEAIVVISPTELSGNAPELQFEVEFIESTNPTLVSDELNEQELGILSPIEPDFQTPAYLEVNLDGYFDLTNIPASMEPYVATYDEESNVWIKVPIIEENVNTNSIVVEAAHFSTWGVGLGSSLPQNGANVLLFDQPYTSLFTGAVRYSVPIWTPAGRVGMAPQVALSYSSSTVDGVLGDVQAPWTGVGWSIDGIEIVRKITTNENGYGYVNDFALTLNGAVYSLIWDSEVPNRYYTDHDAFLYIERHNYMLGNAGVDGVYPPNITGEWWEVVTTDGTHYRLGWNEDAEQLALMYGYKCTSNGTNCNTPDSAYASLGYAGLATDLVALRWRVDKIQDTHGNHITYTYQETQPSTGSTLAPFDRESYLKTIYYTGYGEGVVGLGKYIVNFVYALRTGDKPTTFNIWDNVDSQLLDKIEVCYINCNSPVRTYDLTYTVSPVPNANGTLTLTQIDVEGKNGEITTDAPTIRFTYQNFDNRAVSGSENKYTYPRLVSIDNGAGGLLTYTYGHDGRAADSWYNYRVNQVKVQTNNSTAALQSYDYATPVYTGSGGNILLGDLIGYTTVSENQLNYESSNAVILTTSHTFGTKGLDIGRELKTEWKNSSGAVQRKVTNVYVTDNSQAPHDKWNFRYLYSTLNYELVNSVLTLTNKSVYKKDPSTGNLLSHIQYLGNFIYRKTFYEYKTNPDSSFYILDTVSRVLLTNANNQIYNDTRYHYDNGINIVPTKGDVTLTQVLTGSGNQTVDSSAGYDDYGNVINSTSYQAYGSVDQNPTSTPYTTNVTYDSGLNTYPTLTTNPLSWTTSTQYNYALGLPIQMTDPNGWTTTTTYDGLGRTLSTTAPGLTQPGVYYTYPTVNGSGRLIAPYNVEMQILDTIANQYRSVWGFYDGLGRLLQTQVHDADQNQTLVTDSYFNSQGLTWKQSLPYYSNLVGGYYISPNTNAQFTQTNFDFLGRPTSVTQPGNITSTTTYDDGFTTTTLDPNNHKVSRTTDGLGRLINVKEYDTSTVYATTTYFYDSADRLVKVRDAQQNESIIQYDWLGRKTGMDDPDMGIWSYEYYPSGTLEQQTDARNTVLNFEYDPLGRLTTKTGTGVNITYNYGTQLGTLGMRTGMSDSSGNTTWDYNNYGRMVVENRQIGGSTNSMTTHTDWLGRPISVIYPDSETLTYTYDALGRPDELKNNQQVSLVDLAYTTLGQIDLTTLGNGVIIDNNYNTENRLQSRIASKSSTVLLNFGYTYDNAGNITQITDDVLNETHQYNYDFLNRLTTAKAYTTGNSNNLKYDQQFIYDKVGNILQMNDWVIGGQAYQEPEPSVEQLVDLTDLESSSMHLASFKQQAQDTDTPTPTVTPETFTLTLQPDGTDGLDNYILNSATTTNYGTASDISIGEKNDASGSQARSLIKFDLSSLPTNAVITSATLSLWTSQDLSSNDRTIRVYRLKVPFHETQSTWNISATGSNWQTAGANGANDRETNDIGSTLILNNEALNTEKQIALNTTKIQELINGTFTNNGFIIIADTELDDRFRYHSSDSSTATQHPKLVIQYTLSNETATPSLTPTPTFTNTPSPTATGPTNTPTVTLTPSNTPTATNTKTPVPTNTGMPSPTSSNTPTATNTPSPTSTPTNSTVQPWTFDSTTQSWQALQHISGFAWQTGGYIGGTITGIDPIIYSTSGLGINITTNQQITIRYKNTTSLTTAQFFFITNADTTWDGPKSKIFTVLPNSNYTDYIVDMSGVSGWTGTLNQLRFDPAGNTSGSFSVDYIKIGVYAMTATPTFTPSSTPTPFTFTPTTSSTPTPTAWSGVDAYTVAMLQMDGTDGSTTFTDTTGKAWTANGNSQIDTAQSKFGGASALFDGSGDYLSSPDSNDFAFGNGNFTIDFWMRPNALPTSGLATELWSQVQDTNNYFDFILYNNGSAYYLCAREFVSGAQTLSICNAASVTTGTWYHVAFVRSGNEWKYFLNGTQIGTTQTNAITLNNLSGPVTIGQIFSTWYFNGWMDEFRVSKGLARWTSNFTPPAASSGELPTPTVTPTVAGGIPSAYWNFENGTSTTVPDEATNDAFNNSATLVNGALIESMGFNGKSIFFDGNTTAGQNDYANIADQFEIKTNGSFTISAWVNPASLVTNRTQYIIQKSGDYALFTTTKAGTATPTASPVTNYSNGNIAFQVGGAINKTLIGPILPTNVWTLITGVYDASANEMRLYLNGELVAAQSVTGTLTMGTNPLTFSSATATNAYHGRLDEVRFYSRALSSTEIQNVYSLFPIPQLTPTVTPTLSSATPTYTPTPMPMSQQQWGTGNDGSLTVNTGATFNINTQTNGNNGRTCADAVSYNITLLGSTSASLSSAPASGCLATGDEVLLIQLSTSSATVENAGSYEFLRVQSINGSAITFTTQKTKWYGDGWRSDTNIGTGAGQIRVMLIRVPNYNNVTVNGTLTINAFDGYKYGVLAFRVNGTLSGSGSISASEKGFNSQLGYAPGQIGGGLADQPGGGGGYGTAGANGYGAGGTTYGVANLSKIFFGSGGGNYPPYEKLGEPYDGGAGGSGGGVIFVAGQTINFSGSIIANGQNGINNQHNRKSGAGSGGSIRIEGNTVTLNSISAQGGGVYAAGGAGRVAIYYQTSQTVTSNPSAYFAILGQASTATPIPTSINITPTSPVNTGTGKDGNLTINSGQTFNISTTKNSSPACPQGGDAVAYSIIELNDSWAKVSAAPHTYCLVAGDEILLIHLNGSGSNTGNYEFLRVGGVANDVVYFTTSKTLNYGANASDDTNIGIGAGQQQVMLIRVPNYNNVTVNGTLTINAFDGYKYGVLAFRVNGTLSGSGSISASEKGFNSQLGYAPGQIGGSLAEQPGGAGGYGTAGATSSYGALGGQPYGVSNLTKIFFGSGGGNYSGYLKNEDWYDSAGGGSGGGVILIAGQTINFSGSIASNGQNGGSSPHSRRGGGGAGGSIRIEGNTITLNSVTAQGGSVYAAGGAGRVAIYYQTSQSVTSNPSAYIAQVGITSTTTPSPTVTPTTAPMTNPGTTNLVSWWTMNETSGTRNDSHGSNHLTDNNTVTSATGKQGNAGDFVAANTEYLSRTDPFTLGQLTIGAWVKISDESNHRTILSKWGGSPNKEIILSYDFTTDKFVVVGSTNGTADSTIVYADNFGTVTTNTWYFVVVKYDGTNLSLSVNNSTPNTGTFSGFYNTTQPFIIGYRANNILPHSGSIDEVFYYSRALSASEITWLYNNGLGRTYADVNHQTTGWQNRTYTYSTAIPHAVTSVTSGQTSLGTYTYDANGNMTCRVEDGITYKQEYNTENRISSISKLAEGTCADVIKLSTKWDFAYDGDGVRTSTLTTPYDVNGTPQTASLTAYYFGGAYETRSNGSIFKYYSFGGQSIVNEYKPATQTWELSYLLTDHLGSVVAITNSAGTLVSQQRYLPFGGLRTNVTTPNSPNTDFGYTGQRNLDEGIGLMDYKARFYSPVLNRFIQPDTIVPNPMSPQMWNRFSYVGNNPINFNDPTGHLLNASSNLCNADGWCGSTGNGSSNFVVGPNSDGHNNTPTVTVQDPKQREPETSPYNPCEGSPPYIPPFTCGLQVTGISYPSFISPVESNNDTYTDHSNGGGQVVILNGQSVNPRSTRGVRISSSVDLFTVIVSNLYFNTHAPGFLTSNYVQGVIPFATENSSGNTVISGVGAYNHTNFGLTVSNIEVNGNQYYPGTSEQVGPNDIAFVTLPLQFVLSNTDNSITINYSIYSGNMMTGLGTLSYSGPIGE